MNEPIDALKLVRLCCEAVGWASLFLVVSLLIYMAYELVVENARLNAERLDYAEFRRLNRKEKEASGSEGVR